MRKSSGMDLGGDGSIRNLDVILTKLDAILQKVQQIKATNLGLGSGATAGMGAGVSAFAGSPSVAGGLTFASGGAAVLGQAGVTGTDAISQQMLASAFQRTASPTPSANPFAGQSASGPYSNIGAPGFMLNSFLAQQAASRRDWAIQQGQIARGAAILGGAHFLAGGLNQIAQNTATGDVDPMAAAGLYGGFTGAAVGAVAGMLASPAAPGAGFATGMYAGQQIGSASAQVVMAPYMRTRSMAMTLASMAARSGVSAYDLIQPARSHLNVGESGLSKDRLTDMGEGGLSALAHSISMEGKTPYQKMLISMGLYTGSDIISGPQMAQTFSTLGSALLSSGRDISGAWGMSERLGRRYGLSAPRLAGMAAPVVAAGARTGGNAADLLLEFGPEAYGTYQDVTGGADLTPRQLTAVGNIQRSDYAARRAGLQARGSGAATLAAYKQQMQEIAVLPGGKDSLAYMQSAANARDTEATAFAQRGMTAYGVPMARLQGAMDRLDVMPFSAGSRLGLEVARIGLDRSEFNATRAYRLQRQRAGNLSEEEELPLTQREEGLRTDAARGIASLSLGMENKLPAMTAGRPLRFRGDSMSLAALRMRGTPIRLYGAVGGGQAREQDDFLGGFDAAPFSRTSLMNSTGSHEIVGVLMQIRDLLAGGSRTAPGRTPGGQANATVWPNDMNQNRLYNRAN